MLDLSPNHCCATCAYSQGVPDITMRNDDKLFPMNRMLTCAFHKEELKSYSESGNVAVQFVLVRPDGRCESYDYSTAKYVKIHGPMMEEAI